MGRFTENLYSLKTFGLLIILLQSDEFMKYVQDVGIHISGTSLRITSKDIEEFKF